MFIALLTLFACGGLPDPCEQMCEAAAQVYGRCLTAEGLDWNAAGYEGIEDYLDACDTWAWEKRLIEDTDPLEEGRLDAVCRSRTSKLEGGGCQDYYDIDWDQP
jgi:hypothetical protein